jgi:archaeal flagellar protein FlaJ
MEINKTTIFGVVFGLIVIAFSFVFLLVENLKNYNLFYFLLGIGFLILFSPFVLASVLENKMQREKNEMFLEFSRNLVESVESGTPISKSILNLKPENFGALEPHIQKLANQISLGIPLQKALDTFAQDTKNPMIIRSVTLIREADKTGGNINQILGSVAQSVSEIEKLREERRAAISSIVLEGYIIFFIFIIIMVVVQIQIIPLTENFSGFSGTDFSNIGQLGGESGEQFDFSFSFLSLMVTQGLFAGLIIGKLAEGDLKSGIKHSFILVAMAVLISTGARLFM